MALPRIQELPEGDRTHAQFGLVLQSGGEDQVMTSQACVQALLSPLPSPILDQLLLSHDPRVCTLLACSQSV